MEKQLFQEGWEIASLSSNVTATVPKAVRIHEDDYVLFRDREGKVNALRDACAHRRAPLSLGHVTVEGLIECPYHGWRYNGAGACVAIPNLTEKERIPASYRVGAYPILELSGFVLLWTGTGTPTQVAPCLGLCGELRETDDLEIDIAYPAKCWLDLLLDAPSACLAIEGIRIVDDITFGNPSRTVQSVAVDFAADLPRSRDLSTRVTADYPFVCSISADRSTSLANITLTTDGGEIIARSTLAVTPASAGLCTVHLRRDLGRYAGRQVRVGVRPHPEARLVRAAKKYASLIRRHGLPAATHQLPISLVEENHSGAH